jgi:hypothetical protein
VRKLTSNRRATADHNPDVAPRRFDGNNITQNMGKVPKTSQPPQSGWLDELGRLKSDRVVGLGVARCAPYYNLRFRIVRYHPRHPARGYIG